MNCAEYRDWVAADVDGCTGAEIEEAQRHVAACPECRALRDSVAEVRDVLRARRQVESAPAELRNRILTEIGEASKARTPVSHGWKPLRVAGATAAAAAAAAIALFAVLVYPPGDPADASLGAYELALTGELPLMVQTPDPLELEAFYRARAPAVHPGVHDLSSADFRLRGGTLHQIDGAVLRLSLYSDGEHAIVCDIREAAGFPYPLPDGGEPLFLERNGIKLCIRRVGEYVCVLATQMPMDLFKARLADYAPWAAEKQSAGPLPRP